MSLWREVQDQASGSVIKAEDAKLNKMLNSGIVHFIYRKKPKKGMPPGSGELREAWGTRVGGTIDQIPHGGDCPPKRVGYSIYFDLEKHGWRAFLEGAVVRYWNKVYSDVEFYKMFPDGFAYPTEDLEALERELSAE